MDSRAVAAVTTPSPPIWIRIRMTVRPNRVHWDAVSKTTSPVTQAAEVEVNRASRKVTSSAPVEAQGRHSKKAPVRIMSTKLIRIIRKEER